MNIERDPTLVLVHAADPVPDDHVPVIHVTPHAMVTTIPSHRNDHHDVQIVTVAVRHQNVRTADRKVVHHHEMELIENSQRFII